MSEFSDAFAELMEANDEVCGKPQFIFLNGRKVRAIIETITADEVLVAGGIAESGGFRCQIAHSAVAEQPQQGAPCNTRDTEGLEVLRCEATNGTTYTITAGDPMTEDA